MNYLEQLDTILDCVCKIGGVSVDDVRSRSRVRYLVDLRGVYCLLARELVNDRIATNAAIAKRISRDHAECIYLRKRTCDLLSVNDRVVTPLYTEVRDYLNDFEILD
jgi:chromosomal replication initiation ATPase DnaA